MQQNATSSATPKVKWPATREEIEAAGYRFSGRSTCDGPQCGATIYWTETPDKRRLPLSVASPPGVATRYHAHFTDCPNRAAFMRPKKGNSRS